MRKTLSSILLASGIALTVLCSGCKFSDHFTRVSDDSKYDGNHQPYMGNPAPVGNANSSSYNEVRSKRQ